MLGRRGLLNLAGCPERQRGRAVNAMANACVGSSPTPGHQPSRRGLITGLVSLLAAPAIVRASSLDVLRGVPLGSDLMATEWDGFHREIALGYSTERQAIDQHLYGMSFAQLKREGASFVYDHVDPATLWGGPDVAGLLERS